MRWRQGQKFLVDNYNSWQDRYVWYLQIVDFSSNNNDGDITVDVRLRKYDGTQNPLNEVTVTETGLEREVEAGSIEPIDTLNVEQKTNERTEDDDRNEISDLSL